MSELKSFAIGRLNMSLEDRYNYILKVLSQNDEDDISTSALGDVKSMWAQHLEETLPPCPWTALWKPTRLSKPTPNNSSVSNDVKVNHFVDVIKINYLDMTADIEVLGIELMKQDIPLVELHGPLRVSDDDDKFDLKSANEALDQLHFFLSYLWYPWDDDDDPEDGSGGSDWVAEHLQNRFSLYQKFIQNSDGCDIFIQIGRLAREYSEAHETIRQMQDAGMQDDDDDETPGEDLALLSDLEKRTENIQREANILESPVLRTAFESARLSKKRATHLPENLNCFVWPGGDFNELSQFIEKISQMSSFDRSAYTIVATSLQSAVNRCLPGDQIYLPSGVHSLTDLGDLREGAKILGLNLVETIVEIEIKNFFECFGMRIEGCGANFEGISIRATNGSESALLLRTGTTVLNKVHISGFKTGIKVLPGAALVASRCEIFDCSHGLELETGGCLQALDVDFSHNKVGLLIKDRTGDNIKMERVNVRCEQDVVVVENNDSFFDDSSDGDVLSKAIVSNSSLGDSKVVKSASDVESF